MSDVDREGAVVVGIDGSDGSRAALEFAMDEAALRNLSLRAVTAFEPPDLWLFTAGLSADVAALHQHVREQVEALVEAVADARARRGDPVPRSRWRLTQGRPRRCSSGCRRARRCSWWDTAAVAAREQAHRIGRAELRRARPVHGGRRPPLTGTHRR